ncbi:MAG: hypothetical protein ACI87N_003706, partial [Flavobacteriales bacterium]
TMDFKMSMLKVHFLFFFIKKRVVAKLKLG